MLMPKYNLELDFFFSIRGSVKQYNWSLSDINNVNFKYDIYIYHENCYKGGIY
jgi:hypothetical protein